MVFILFMHYGSIQLSVQVLVAIPMAFIGAVVYLVIENSIISIATLVGFISLGAREMYDKRVQPPVAAKFDYFHYELVNTLAEGDDNRLGGSYPGSTV